VLPIFHELEEIYLSHLSLYLLMKQYISSEGEILVLYVSDKTGLLQVTRRLASSEQNGTVERITVSSCGMCTT
jgi:hypothetical protein